MKALILKWSALTLFVTSLAACSFSKNANEENARENEDRAVLLEQYSHVVGLYRGTVTTQTTVQHVDISLYTTEVRDGFTSNGDPRFRPILKATYSRTDTVLDDVTLDVRYLPETGELHMSNSSETGAAATTLLTVDATADQISMSGRVTTNAGVLGTLSARLITREAHAPSQGDQDEKNRQAIAIYQKVAGVYMGQLTPTDTHAPKQLIRLVLYVDQMTTTDRGPIPVLNARAQNLTLDPVGSFTNILRITYQPDAVPPKMTMVTVQVVQNPTSTYHLAIDGTISNGVISATYVDNLNSQGVIELQLQK